MSRTVAESGELKIMRPRGPGVRDGSQLSVNAAAPAGVCMQPPAAPCLVKTTVATALRQPSTGRAKS